MPPLRHHAQDMKDQASSSKRGRSKYILSQKRLQDMIQRGQGTDSQLTSSKAIFDNSDLRTKAEKDALLLWVCH